MRPVQGNNTVKGEKGDLVTDSHGILAGWMNHFSELFNLLAPEFGI